MAGFALLVLAVACLRLAHADASRLFAYDNDAAAAHFLARVTFGLSLLAQIAAVYDAKEAWRWQGERGTVFSALAVTAVWAASALFVALR